MSVTLFNNRENITRKKTISFRLHNRSTVENLLLRCGSFTRSLWVVPFWGALLGFCCFRQSLVALSFIPHFAISVQYTCLPLPPPPPNNPTIFTSYLLPSEDVEVGARLDGRLAEKEVLLKSNLAAFFEDLAGLAHLERLSDRAGGCTKQA